MKKIFLIAAGLLFSGFSLADTSPFPAQGATNETWEKEASDYINQYNIVKADGNKQQMCIRSGAVAEAYLQANNADKYHEWTAISKQDCKQ